jgi:FkbM family methyltransferase
MRYLYHWKCGLGDAVQLAAVLRVQRRLQPQTVLDTLTAPGQASCFADVAHKAMTEGQDTWSRRDYDRVLETDWPECPRVLLGVPSTKMEWYCLRKFRQLPQPSECHYAFLVRPAARERVEAWLRAQGAGRPGEGGRYNVLAVHATGSSPTTARDLTATETAGVLAAAREAGLVPLLLDWHSRHPAAGDPGVLCPRRDDPLWGGQLGPDAEILAALLGMVRIVVAIDSGPLHVAAATTTPTLACWVRHHPLHYVPPTETVRNFVPADHERYIRPNRALGLSYFAEHYRYERYTHLLTALQGAIATLAKAPTDGLIYERGYWVRSDYRAADLVCVADVDEGDCYDLAHVPEGPAVIVDVGAHIGTFARAAHRRWPAARIICVEANAANLAALARNVEGIATVVHAAVTYEPEVALINTVTPGSHNTGGSSVHPRGVLEELARSGRPLVAADGFSRGIADMRPLRSITLEQLCLAYQLPCIDLLKLDCEGSELTILENYSTPEQIGRIVGEYHGQARWRRLLGDRYAGWPYREIRGGEIGTFWMHAPR